MTMASFLFDEKFDSFRNLQGLSFGYRHDHV